MIFAKKKIMKLLEGDMYKNQVLLLYENPYNQEYIKNYLDAKGYSVKIAVDYNEALRMVAAMPIELFLTDLEFANQPSSREYQRIKLINPVILLLKVRIGTSFADNRPDSEFDFFKRMINTLDVFENTRTLYRYKSN
jgi:response regulator RpfG family c-di-GMP phosphodiesterase